MTQQVKTSDQLNKAVTELDPAQAQLVFDIFLLPSLSIVLKSDSIIPLSRNLFTFDIAELRVKFSQVSDVQTLIALNLFSRTIQFVLFHTVQGYSVKRLNHIK